MTPEQLKISVLKYAFKGSMCTSSFPIEDWEDIESSLYKFMWEVTAWDKKFKEVDKYKQSKVISYTYVLAGEFSKLEEKDGDILLLSTGKYVGYTTEEKAKDLISEGEVVTLPWGGGPTIKYYKGKFVTADNRIATSLDTDIFSNKYLYYYMQSQVNFLASIYRGTGLKHPKMSAILDMRVPLPPIEEQHRIVARIEQLLPYVDRYAASYEKLEQFNAKFPEDMKKSILQYAIQGKLVEQRTEEGTAEELYQKIQKEKEKLIKEKKIKKEKSLDAITEDEIPFDIPESWKWVRLPEVGELSRGRSKHRPRNDVSLFKGGGIPFIQTGDVAQTNHLITKWTTEYNQKGLEQSRLWPKGTLCLTIAANIGDVGLLDFDACFPDSVVGFNAYNPIIDNRYFVYGLMCYKNIFDKLSYSTAQKNINLEIISHVPFPLPPLEEQKRIVAKIEKILPYCDRLVK